MKFCQKCGSLFFEEENKGGEGLLCFDCIFYMKLLNYYVAYRKRVSRKGGKEREKCLVKEGV